MKISYYFLSKVERNKNLQSMRGHFFITKDLFNVSRFFMEDFNFDQRKKERKRGIEVPTKMESS